MTRSPLIWFGGKSKLARDIIRLMPAHTCYVEPFGGAAHVIAAKSPVPFEVYNDIDGEVVNFLLIVRAETERFVVEADSLPYSRKLYETWKFEPWPQDDFTRAVRWFYLNRSGIAKGNADRTTGWRHSPEVNVARAYHNAIADIQTFVERMRNVQIECRDFREIIRVYDSPDTMFYVDPPYIGRESCYAGGFADIDHLELSEMLKGIKGKAIVSYYDDPLLLELYPKWHRDYLTGYVQSVGGSGPRRAEELLLMNYGSTQQTLSV